uniref:Uncharacterized protein n=1 Tax=Bacillus phage KoopaTroopa TaxID=3234046 RepID=A0AB39C7G7_9CAUD
MKISIASLGGSIKDYEELLKDKVDFEKHYVVIRDEMIYNAWGEGKHKHCFADELKDVEVESLEELFAIFEGFRDWSGFAGQLTVDVTNNIVYVLDTWIE